MNDNIGKIFVCGRNFYNISENPFPFEPGRLSTGDLYEVLRAIDGKLLFYRDHIERLEKSISLTEIDYKIDSVNLQKDLINLIKNNGYVNCNIKIVLTHCNNNYYLYAYLSKFSYPDESLYSGGVIVDFFEIERNNPNIKVINEDYKRAVTKAIQENGLFEVLLINKDGYVTEGSRTNVFFIVNDNVYTAPTDMVLEGITRKYIIQACKEAGLKVVEKAFTKNDIAKCHGVFLSGTSIKALPVEKIGSLELSTGKNDIFKRILSNFNKILLNNLDC